jgi:pimeloyl-ACP methyl ester carboxylesterase
MLLPIPLLFDFLLGLLSLVIPAFALAALYRAWRNYQKLSNVPRTKRVLVGDTQVEAASDTNRSLRLSNVLRERPVWLPLLIGVCLLLFTFAGRSMLHLGYPSGDDPRAVQSGDVRYIDRPDGTKLRVEIFGPPDGPTIIFTHGWGTSNTEWYYAKRDLREHFRLIFWDLPGLGESTQPNHRDYSLEKMASDLDSVVGLAQGQPTVIVGHSIGGMINLTFCRLFPQRLRGGPVRGIVQVDTSYTNPVRTTKNASLNLALQKPIAEPLLHAMIWLSPLVRVMNWLSYQNGTSHLSNARSAFAGSETWGQLDLISRYGYESTPSVVARGTLAMFHWDATPVLPTVNVPVLLIVGQQDTTTLPEASEFMQKAMPSASLEVVNPSAHYGLLEQNKRYDAALERFASTTLKGRTAE